LQLFLLKRGNRRGYVYRHKGESDINVLRRLGYIASPQSLSDTVKQRESALKKYFQARAHYKFELEKEEPLLVVARRWNSWYPSFFDVSGGAYAIIGAKAASDPTPGSLIDPGFRSLGVLNKLGIPVGLLKTCIVTHNHPDHVGGVLEYIASRHVLGEKTSVFCSSSVFQLLDTYRGDHLDVHRVGDINFDILSPYNAIGAKRRIVATPIKTSHIDAGSAEGTFGIVIASEIHNNNGQFRLCATTMILGDTEYDGREYAPNASLFNRIREMLATKKLKVVVLHIGCSQFKEGTGKHLYLAGLIEVLKYLDYVRRNVVDDDQPLLVLVSEWGLEHASAKQIRKVLPKKNYKELAKSFGRDNLIESTMRVIEKVCPSERLKIMPADVGLIVGMESGHIYIDGLKTSPEDVDVDYTDKGIEYRRK
jgi:hypothetical protein